MPPAVHPVAGPGSDLRLGRERVVERGVLRDPSLPFSGSHSTRDRATEVDDVRSTPAGHGAPWRSEVHRCHGA